MIRWWRERKKREKAEAEKERSDRMDIIKQNINKEEYAMCHSQCPFLNMKLCTVHCIHFQKGRIPKIYTNGDSFEYLGLIQLPKCKLWK